MEVTQLTEIVFLSQRWAEAYMPRSDEAIISITDHGKPEADLNPGWIACLRLSFDDVDPIESPAEPGEDLTEIQEGQAIQMAEFVHRIASRAKVLVVHCRFGQSRSAGVAKAIAEHYGLYFPQDYEYANNHVHQLLLRSLRQQSGA